MANVKKTVGPFELETAESGYYRWTNRQDVGRGTLVYVMSIDKVGDIWRLHSGLYGEGFQSRQPEVVQDVEQYGAPSGYAQKFKPAKKMAYDFMQAFSGSPGYNGLIDLAAEARWVNEHLGPY